MTLRTIKNGLSAFLASIIVPGLGQIYNGQLLKGVLGFGALLGLLLVSTAVGLTHSFVGLVIHTTFFCIVYLILLGDAVFTAIRQTRVGQRPAHSWRSYLLGLLLLLVTIFFLSNNVPGRIPGVRGYKMSADSMLPTLSAEDHILADARYYGSHAPQRGDLIFFTFPYMDHPTYIKRVIGIPGDRVKIVDRQVYVNGQRISEPYVAHDRFGPSDPIGDNFPPHGPEDLQANMEPEWAGRIFQYVRGDELIVPPNAYFTLGDNREHSWDSRYWGPVARDKIFAKALYIYWSKDRARIGQTLR